MTCLGNVQEVSGKSPEEGKQCVGGQLFECIILRLLTLCVVCYVAIMRWVRLGLPRDKNKTSKPTLKECYCYHVEG